MRRVRLDSGLWLTIPRFWTAWIFRAHRYQLINGKARRC